MNKKWAKAVAIRVIKTMAETAISVIGTTALITEVNLSVVVSSTLLSGLLTVLFALKGLPEASEEGE